MFPIPWNFPLRKKNGNLVNIGDAIDEGTELPAHGEGDAGKVLSVDENGGLEWSDDVNSEIQTLTNEVDTIVNDLIAKNIAQIELVEQTIHGVALSIVDNTMIKMNGTATVSSAISNVWKAHLKPGTYIASIDVISGSHNTNKTIWFEKNTETTGINPDITITTETHKEKEFTVETEGDYHFQIGFQNTDAFNNLVVAYMIRPASIKDGTFVPYAMTNRELTERITWKLAIKDTNSEYTLTEPYSELLVYVGWSASAKIAFNIIEPLTYYLTYDGSAKFNVIVQLLNNKLTPTVTRNGESATPYMTVYYR